MKIPLSDLSAEQLNNVARIALTNPEEVLVSEYLQMASEHRRRAELMLQMEDALLKLAGEREPYEKGHID